LLPNLLPTLLPAVLCALWATAPALIAAEPVGRSAVPRSAKDEAIRSIPMERLPADVRGKVMTVVKEVSVYRRLPIETADCEPDLFRFLVNNPDLLVNIWRVMGISNVALDRTDANHFHCTDGDGTTANVQVIFRSAQMQIIYADGLYDGPLFPRPVRGQCVAILQYSNRKVNGRFEETVKLDTFLRVDNVGIELLAKMFQGLVGKTIDHNFAETVAFIGSVSHTAEVNPRAVRRLAGKLDHVEQERRDQFTAVSDSVAEKVADIRLTDNEEEHPALAQALDSSGAQASPPTALK
jgi:hypothetical protein